MNPFVVFMNAIRGIDPFPYVPDVEPAQSPNNKTGMLVLDGMGTLPKEAVMERIRERIREEITQEQREAIAEEKSGRQSRLFKDHRKFKGRWEQ